MARVQAYLPLMTDATRPALGSGRALTPSYTHSVRLAEDVEASMVTATLMQRFWAFLLDTLSMTVIVLIAVLFAELTLQSWFAIGMLLAYYIALFVYFGYFFICEGLLVGQTPGKLAVGIRVVDLHGRPMTPVAGLVRSFARFPMIMAAPQLLASAFGGAEQDMITTVLMLCACADVLYALADPRSRRLGDVAAGTVVVSQRIPPVFGTVPRMPRYAELPVHVFPLRAEQLNRLSPADFATLEDFGARIRSFGQPRREQAATVVAGALATRMRYHLPVTPADAERFLYEVHCALRDQFRQLYPDLY